MHHMAHYRAYIVGPDGHFIEARDLDCANDATAVDTAKRLLNGHDVEVWQADRMITKLKIQKS
jgi:hypothetical protein